MNGIRGLQAHRRAGSLSVQWKVDSQRADAATHERVADGVGHALLARPESVQEQRGGNRLVRVRQRQDGWHAVDAVDELDVVPHAGRNVAGCADDG